MNKREKDRVNGVESDFSFTFDGTACKSCGGLCCTGESGNVYLTHIEAEAIARFLKINRVDFLRKYTRSSHNRLALLENAVDDVYECVFFNAKASCCQIYDVRPRQCATFPFWQVFLKRPEWALKECPGVQMKEKDSLCKRTKK
ncbi:MAG: zinc/iron-chelating domain-containing protein [Acidobacteria bacterium]|nr:MAG: zinc/iron-chelating domain-containing protein [Acidobacteriota bacterium]PIE89157.1 MAG: zinc/iron-chelating domain-containing protein [Acidobacteriota bacterium]